MQAIHNDIRGTAQQKNKLGINRRFYMKTKIFMAAFVSTMLLACGDIADPALDGQSALFAKGGQRISTTSTESATDAANSGTVTESGIPNVLRFAAGASPLKTYDTTFVAHQGWKQHFVIFHEDGNYFMVLDVPASAQFVDPNGNPIPNGETVDITVHVDSTHVSFEFGPHGSYFTGKRPVLLWIYLKYVDLEGASGDPAAWYQPNTDTTWTALPSTIDKAGNWIKTELRHFSNYAIAW